MSTRKIEAIFESDLQSVLKDLDLNEKLQSGELKCYFCAQIITIENLQYIFPDKGDLQVGCNRPSCLLAAEGLAK
jgi:hypothetical protein